MRRRRRHERGLAADLLALVLRTVVAGAIAVGTMTLLFLWRAPAGPQGAMLDLVIRFYTPVLWIVLATSVLVVVVPALLWSYRRLR